MPGRLPLPGESRATANRLAATDKLVTEKQWSEAIDEYLHILEEAGDELIPLDSAQYLCARRLCHQRLAALPPDALRLYRDRVESQAKKWFEQGKDEREPLLLLPRSCPVVCLCLARAEPRPTGSQPPTNW